MGFRKKKRNKNTAIRSTSTLSFRGAEAASYRVVEPQASTGERYAGEPRTGGPDRRTREPARDPASRSAIAIPVAEYSAETDHDNLPPAGNDPRRSAKKPRRRTPGKAIKIVISIFLIVALVFVGMRIFLKNAFAKTEKYELDTEDVTTHGYDDNMKKYTNIALFGVDSQDNVIRTKGSRTDCIIICSINNRSKDIKLLSIFRDTYVSINGNYDKINAAYSYGGPELALSTINRNLDLDITDFATVNFKALADAVDVLDGIELEIKSKKELKNLNDYIGNMNKINGGHSKKFKKTGSYTFDGNQAVAYSRIRYMEGGDHERANHQRLVVQGILHKLKTHPWKINALIDTVLPQCVTSLSDSELTSLSLSMIRSSIEDSQAYPFDSDDSKYNGIWYGFPLTTKSNTIKAHAYLFGTEDYEPSEELCKISKKVKNVTDAIGLSN